MSLRSKPLDESCLSQVSAAMLAAGSARKSAKPFSSSRGTTDKRPKTNRQPLRDYQFLYPEGYVLGALVLMVGIEVTLISTTD